MIITSKYNRQLDLVSPTDLTLSIHIVGAGAIGSWTALSLAKLGCQSLSIQDFDRVSIENTACQLYGEDTIGQLKTEALKQYILNLTGLNITAIEGQYPEVRQTADLIISAVDSMAIRDLIWEQVKRTPSIRHFIDARMSGDLIRLYALSKDNADYQLKAISYQKTLVSDDEIEPESCSARSVVYNTLFCGGLIANLVKHLVKHQPFKWEYIVNLYDVEIL